MAPGTRALLSDVLIFFFKKEKHNPEILCEISRFKNFSNFLNTAEIITKGHVSARGWWVSATALGAAAPQSRPRPSLDVLSVGTSLVAAE